MEYLGVRVELLLFGLGLYLYLFSRDLIKIKDEERQAKAAAFREQNGMWMRYLGLGLAAIMGLNLMLHLRMLLG